MTSARVEQAVNIVLRPFIGSCEATMELPSDHHEGTPRPGRERRVSRHLRFCPRCRELYESLVRTVERVRSLGREDEPPAPAAATVDAVMERIRRPNP
jgi:predicted anti-sigma-YlaC factor YlaD